MSEAATVTRNRAYFCSPVYLQVENEVFCVPRRELIESSEVFSDMFDMPQGDCAASAVEGSTEDHPIILEQVFKGDFEALLKVLYPSPSLYFAHVPPELSKEELVSILSLSTRFNVKGARNFAIRKLSAEHVLNAKEKILLARAHQVSRWLVEGYEAYVNGDELIDQDRDGEEIGWRTVARLMLGKERVHVEVCGARSPEKAVNVKEIFCGCGRASKSIYSDETLPTCESCSAKAEIVYVSSPSSISTDGPYRSISGCYVEQRCTCGWDGLAFPSYVTLQCQACSQHPTDRTVRWKPINAQMVVKEHFRDEITSLIFNQE